MTYVLFGDGIFEFKKRFLIVILNEVKKLNKIWG